MMDMLVTAIQSLCGAGLVLGIVLCLYQSARPSTETRGLDYAAANDFETGHRRWVRKRR